MRQIMRRQNESTINTKKNVSEQKQSEDKLHHQEMQHQKMQHQMFKKMPEKLATADAPPRKIQTTPRHQQKHHHIAPTNAPNKNMCTYTYIHIDTHIHTHIKAIRFTNPTGAQHTTAPTYAIFWIT